MRPRACTQPLRPRLPELTPSHLWHVGTASGFTPYSAPQTEVSGSVRCRPSEVFNSRPRWVRKLRLYHGPKHHHMQPRTSGFAAGHWTTPSATGLSLEPRVPVPWPVPPAEGWGLRPDSRLSPNPVPQPALQPPGKVSPVSITNVLSSDPFLPRS